MISMGDDSLAILAHRLWWHWSMHIAGEEDISEDRLDRWERFWAPFEDLDEDIQNVDRELVERFLEERPDRISDPIWDRAGRDAAPVELEPDLNGQQAYNGPRILPSTEGDE